MSVEKFTSGKAKIEVRPNPKKSHHRCHVVVGKKRVGPITVRVGDDGDSADAAQKALERTVKDGRVDADKLEQEGGAIAVHAASERGRSRVKAKAPTAKGRFTVKAARAPKTTGAPKRHRKVKRRAGAKANQERHIPIGVLRLRLHRLEQVVGERTAAGENGR